jgi:MFS transporter, SHS family, sialic acid transporter
MTEASLSPRQRLAVLGASFLALLFDGMELGLMPVASLSVSKSLLGASFTKEVGGEWFAYFTAALMLGAAIGGIAFGSLGDRLGRTRAMGVSILFYSVFAALGSLVQTQEQMLVLRFLVGLGVGGLWPNGIALVSECWPAARKPLVSGLMMAGLNAGILALSQLARLWPITAENWRWLFQLAGLPALLGLVVLRMLPESPHWLASRGQIKRKEPLVELFSPQFRRITFIGILVSAIPMIGAWSAGKWMIPWADSIAGSTHPGYKAATQGWWALGAVLGSITGAQLAAWLGRRLSYALMCLATVITTVVMFQATAPMQSGFLVIVFAQGFIATLLFGWLALFLPELFPTRVRATGSGLSYNSGRFATAAGVLVAGMIFTQLGGSYPTVGTACALIYAIGCIVIWWAPETANTDNKP